MRTRSFLLGYAGLLVLALVFCFWADFQPRRVRPKGVMQVHVPPDAVNHALCKKLAPQLADCPVPDARKTEYASFNRPILRWNAAVLSATSTKNGHEATVRVKPFLGGTWFTTHTTLETWRVSADGDLTLLKMSTEPGFLFID